MVFSFTQKVLFKHCDPAGIVFFPRYFEMMNDCVEAFFEEALKWPFESFHITGGVPTVTIATKFTAPSRHGDKLILSLEILRIGRTSFGYLMAAHCSDEQRFSTEAILVHTNKEGKPQPIPETVRLHLKKFIKAGL